MSILNGEEALGASRTYTKKEIHKVYKPAGTKTVAELTSSLLVAENLGNVYNISDSGVTTSDFVEGAGHPINAGDNVDVVDVGSGDSHVYKFDLYMGADLSSKADKVTNATSGHLAGLDSNGNLTDSGVSPTEDVTVEGNPVTFDSPFEQDAKSVVVSVKPIQDLHGYDHPWVGGAGKNLYIGSPSFDGYTDINTYAVSSETYNGHEVIYKSTPWSGAYKNVPLKANVTYTFSALVKCENEQTVYIFSKDAELVRQSIGNTWTRISAQITPTEDVIEKLRVESSTNNNTIYLSEYQIEVGSSATSYASYSNICPISGIDEVEIGVSDGESEPTTTTIPLPSTLYDADVDVTEGDADSRFKKVNLADYNWTFVGTPETGRWIVGDNNYVGPASNNEKGNFLCDTYAPMSFNALMSSQTPVDYGIALQQNSDHTISCKNGSSTVPPTGYICYELATPTTISFTPADVELLEGTNVVSTNAEKVAVKYGRSLWQDIDDLKTDTEGKLDKSDVATIEGDTASKAYSVNDFMLRADGLYKVTQPIASGASITASNTTKTTVGEVLTALLNA